MIHIRAGRRADLFPSSLLSSLASFPVTAQVAVEHLNMLVGLVEEMTCKWERQLENDGEGRWTDDMLAREGTEGKTNQCPPLARSRAVVRANGAAREPVIT